MDGGGEGANGIRGIGRTGEVKWMSGGVVVCRYHCRCAGLSKERSVVWREEKKRWKSVDGRERR